MGTKGMMQLMRGGQLRDPAIVRAAARVYQIRERSKRVRKRLKDLEDQAVMVLAAHLSRRGLEACKVGPYIIMADSRVKIRIQKKLEKAVGGRRRKG